MGNIVKVNLRQPESYNEFIAYASFNTEPSTSNKAIAVNNEVLKQELDSLFSTRRYERPYLQDYYNPLEELIGELYTTESETLALHVVTDKVNRFIPRITIDSNTRFTFKDYKVDMELVFYYKNDFSRALYSYKRAFDVIT